MPRVKPYRMQEEVWRVCCRCKVSKRVQLHFTPSNKRCFPCAKEYAIELADRRARGEPPMVRASNKVAPQPEPVQRVQFIEEFKHFFSLSAQTGANGNAPPIP